MNQLLLVAIVAVAIVWSVIMFIAIIRAQKRGTDLVPVTILWLVGAMALLPAAIDPDFHRGVSAAPQELVVRLNRSLSLVLFFVSVSAILTRRRLGFANPIFLLLATLWLVAGIASVLNGSTDILPIAVLITAVVAVGFHAVHTSRVIFHSRVILRLYILASLAASIIAPDNAWLDDGWRTLAGIPQFIGIASHPNAVGALAALSLVLECYRGVTTKFQWLFWPLAAIVVVLAQSRTGWVIALIGLACLVAVSRRTGRLRGWTVWAGAVAFSASAIFLFTAELSDVNDLTTGRLNDWIAMLTLVPETWLYGGGQQVLANALGSGDLVGVGPWGAQAHNQVIQTLLDSGVFGVLVLVVLLTAMIKQAFQDRGSVLPLRLAALAMLLLTTLVETPLRPTLGQTSIALVIYVLLLSAPSASRRLDPAGSGVKLA